MNAIKRYELIRPILNHEKTPQQVHQETHIPLSTIYCYLERFRRGDGAIEPSSEKAEGH